MKLINSRQIVLGSAAAALLAGCQQNPFPADVHLVDRAPVVTVVKSYVLDVPPVMEFTECQSAEYTFRAEMPAGETPRVEVTNLPAGAVFHADAMRLSWIPSTHAAGDGDGSQGSQTYQIGVTLQSEEDPKTVVQRTAVLVVKAGGNKRRFELDRQQWPQGSSKDITKGQETPIGVPLKFHVLFHFPVQMTVSPASMRSEVFWSDDVLTITPKVAGTRIFSITATGKGETEVEYFTINVPGPPNPGSSGLTEEPF